jgi:hypothetical protein
MCFNVGRPRATCKKRPFAQALLLAPPKQSAHNLQTAPPTVCKQSAPANPKPTRACKGSDAHLRLLPPPAAPTPAAAAAPAATAAAAPAGSGRGGRHRVCRQGDQIVKGQQGGLRGAGRGGPV